MSQENHLDTNLIPEADVMSLPIVQELSKVIDIAGFKIPLEIPMKTLMEEGTWNNHYYSEESISKALQNTDWNDRNKRDLFLDHEERKAAEWVGEVTNLKMQGKKLIGNLLIHDFPTAVKLQSGRPKFGISPAIKGKNDVHTGEVFDFLFDNFSIVINPAVKTAYINNMEVENMDDKKIRLEDVEKPEEPKPEAQPEPAPEPTPAPEGGGEGEEKKEVEPKEEDEEDEDKKELSELDGSIKALERTLSELKGKRDVISPKKDLVSTKLSAIEERLVGFEKLIKSNIPDRRSINGQSGSSKAETFRARYNEIKGREDSAFTKFLESKVIDQGEIA